MSRLLRKTTGIVGLSMLCGSAVMHVPAARSPEPLAGETSMQPSSASPQSGPVTLIVSNARIWTGVPERPWAEALAVSGDRLVAVGTNADVSRRSASTDTTSPDRPTFVAGSRPDAQQRPASPIRIDAGGALVVPGFIDSHVHFLEGGMRLASVQLRDAKTRDEFVSRIREFAAGVPSGTWIRGGDWDHENWGGVLPSREWIDAATPHHPVWVNRLDGHMALANSLALKQAGVDERTRDVDGGRIERDAAGRPTGLLRDNAMSLVERVVPEPGAAELDGALAAAMRYVAERGVTSVQHMGTFEDLEVFERANRNGTLSTRIYAAIPLGQWQRLAGVVSSRRFGSDGRGDAWLRIGALKGFVDGSLGSHTAAFHDPFIDAPENRGLLVNSEADLYTWIQGADKAALHVAVHAIGDRANGILLDIYERVSREHGRRDRRFRIEHAQHLAARDIERFARLGVIASMQPYHAIDDGRWADKVIGPERAKTTYAFRGLLDAGARLAFGSDWYVAPPSPLEGIYAAVTRRTLDGARPDGWVPSQKITVEQALRAYTVDAAYASFEEGTKGTLQPDRLADFVILDRDLFTIPPEQIRDVKVTTTVIGGRVVER